MGLNGRFGDGVAVGVDNVCAWSIGDSSCVFIGRQCLYIFACWFVQAPCGGVKVILKEYSETKQRRDILIRKNGVS